AARRDSLGKPGLDFFLHPSHRPPAQAHRPGKCALRDAQINRAARQTSAGFDCGKSQYRIGHVVRSLMRFGTWLRLLKSPLAEAKTLCAAAASRCSAPAWG